MRKSTPINVIIHYLMTEEGKKDLASRVSRVQAYFVVATSHKLNCPMLRKLALLNVVIEFAQQRKRRG